MKQRRTTGGTRPAFTMIELLIVVAIIAVLVAMMTGAVMRALSLGNRTEVASDIMKMDSSLKVAMQKYNGIPFLPSHLRLRNSVTAYNSADAVDRQSLLVLRMMFGKRVLSTTAPVPTLSWTPSAPAVLNLTGPECLVFYLGGVYDGTRLIGFSSDPRNPTAAGGERIGPFFDFKPNRLVSSNGYFRYNDPYGTAYAYFGPTSANGYADSAADCTGVGLAAPYHDSASSAPNLRYLNPNTFQIVAAGPNRTFGSGGAWDVRNGTADQATRDNLTNFSQSELGDGQQ